MARYKGQQHRALGRSRGGFSIKIHFKTDLDGLPLDFHLTGGEASDSTQFETSFDIDNLITVISGSLDLISKLNDDERIERLIRIAQRASARGAKLTNLLLAFSRKPVLRPQTSDMNAPVTAFEDLLRQGIDESTKFRLKLGSKLWLVILIRAKFQSALLNLVVNARDAMKKGGTLTIKTRNTRVDRLAAAKLTEIDPGPFIVVTVEDTGEGMTPEVRARAIEPFYSTKDADRGTGLGLSQVYGFVRQSNGQMMIRSEVREAHRSAYTCLSLPKPKE